MINWFDWYLSHWKSRLHLLVMLAHNFRTFLIFKKLATTFVLTSFWDTQFIPRYSIIKFALPLVQSYILLAFEWFCTDIIVKKQSHYYLKETHHKILCLSQVCGHPDLHLPNQSKSKKFNQQSITNLKFDITPKEANITWFLRNMLRVSALKARTWTYCVPGHYQNIIKIL